MRGDMVFQAQGKKLPCEVCDISDKGARIKTPDAFTIPELFMLVVPRRHLESRVRVMRRSQNEVGVVFLD
jgi:hypothetical protein